MKVTADAPGTCTLAGRARQLGEQHAAGGIAPFGGADDVYWGAGSAELMAALGETGPATEENSPERTAAVEAYCDALGAPMPLVTPERRALYEAILEREAARRGPTLLPEPAGGSQ